MFKKVRLELAAYEVLVVKFRHHLNPQLWDISNDYIGLS